MLISILQIRMEQKTNKVRKARGQKYWTAIVYARNDSGIQHGSGSKKGELQETF